MSNVNNATDVKEPAPSLAWVTPVIEDLGSITEITLGGSVVGLDRKQVGCHPPCC
jgi:hypothetical protein